MRRAATLLVTAMAALAPCAVRAHEVLYRLQWNRAVALRAYFADGEAMAYAEYEVYSPTDPKIPHQKGRTDRDGWIAFVPDAPGAWRVKVVDKTGHGLDVAFDPAPPTSAAAAVSIAGTPASTAAFVLRPIVGVAAIALVFGFLFAVYRRRGAPR